MASEDRDYFYRRAEQEIACAQSSASERLVRFHYQLAALYLDRVFGADGDQRPDTLLVSGLSRWTRRVSGR
jgi:hypothetical protein